MFCTRLSNKINFSFRYNSYVIDRYNPSKDDVAIRKIAHENLPRLRSLPLGSLFSDQNSDEYLQEVLSALKICKVKVIRENKITVGYICYHRIDSSFLGKIGKIEQLAVDANYRGNGYGAILLKKAMEDLKKNDQVDCIKLDYTQSIDRLKLEEFYIRHGFQLLKPPTTREAGSMALSFLNPKTKKEKIREMLLLAKPTSPFFPKLFLSMGIVCCVNYLFQD